MVNIIIALIVSVDSFFISLLTCGKTSLKSAVLIVSPMLHICCCMLGLLIERNISSFVSRGIVVVVGMVIVVAGGYLVVMYKPQLPGKEKLLYIEKNSIRLIVILLMFCSLDALAAGYIYGFRKTSIIEAILCIGIVNLSMVSGALLTGWLLRSSETESMREVQI